MRSTPSSISSLALQPNNLSRTAASNSNEFELITQQRRPEQLHSSPQSIISETTTFTLTPHDEDRFITDIPRNRQSHRRAGIVVFRAWGEEFFLLLLAFWLIAAIITLLRTLSGSPLPSWPIGLNLSTILAILATLLRSSLVIVTESVIGQAKWIWQRQPRPVRHLAYFDDASRGPWGSFLLLFKVPKLFRHKYLLSRHGSSAIFCCVVTVLSTAIGSLTQQALNVVQCDKPIPGITASILFASRESHIPLIYYQDNNQLVRDVDTGTKARVMNAFVNPGVRQTVLFNNCVSGNCTFNETNGITHSTAGFCNKCVNTSPLLRRTNQLLKISDEFEILEQFTLPNDIVIGNFSLSPLSNITASPSMQVSTEDHLDWASPEMDAAMVSILNSSAINVSVTSLTKHGCNNGTRIDPVLPCSQKETGELSKWNAVAAICSIYTCSRDLNAEIRNGELKEYVIHENPLPIMHEQGTNETDHAASLKTHCRFAGVEYDHQNVSSLLTKESSPGYVPIFEGGETLYVPEECANSIAPEILDVFLELIRKLTNSKCVESMTTEDDRTNLRITSCLDAWWLTPLFNSGKATFEHISKTMDAVALAMTDSLRVAGDAADSYTVEGIAIESSICIEFNWAWLVYPVTLLALTTISFFLTVWSAFDDVQFPGWKNSILPAIYGGSSTRKEGEQEIISHSLEELERESQHDMAVLARREDGFLTLQRLESLSF
ncbi:hypothetical protein CC78DRAFT_604027 [Lojkania enalia]|uniref:Transmembrane protein n=1 Tax=Lojkania enalia TaxID=147567 RepID=A0A9P4N9Y8_9PLEO|nr:hypothetical protein CC78DRAFT_604027 [Didymosphaeria enalia]